MNTSTRGPSLASVARSRGQLGLGLADVALCHVDGEPRQREAQYQDQSEDHTHVLSSHRCPRWPAVAHARGGITVSAFGQRMTAPIRELRYCRTDRAFGNRSGDVACQVRAISLSGCKVAARPAEDHDAAVRRPSRRLRRRSVPKELPQSCCVSDQIGSTSRATARARRSCSAQLMRHLTEASGPSICRDRSRCRGRSAVLPEGA